MLATLKGKGPEFANVLAGEDCSGISTTGARSRPMPESRPRGGAAARSLVSRAFRSPVIRNCARQWSRQHGCGCATSRTRPVAVVSGACRPQRGTRQEGRHHRTGAQAPRGVLEIRHERRRDRGCCHDEGAINRSHVTQSSGHQSAPMGPGERTVTLLGPTSRHQEWSRSLEPSPERLIMVLPSRTATGCEVVQARRVRRYS